MPKPRVEEVIAVDGGQFEDVKREVKEREVVKYAEYRRPTLSHFKQFILDLDEKAAEGEESPLDRAYRLFINSLDREATAKVYQSLAAESTEISVGGVKRDLMSVPIAQLVPAVNGYIGQRSLKLMLMNLPPDATAAQRQEAEETVDKSIGFGPWRTVIRKLSEGYEDAKGNKVAPVARVNEAAGGILELLPA